MFFGASSKKYRPSWDNYLRAVAKINFRNGGRDFDFWRGARSKAISLVDLAETDNEAKKQKHPGLRLKLGAVRTI